MSDLSKLQNGPFRHGRGGLSESERQLETESIERDRQLRAAILELASEAGVTIGGGGSGSGSSSSSGGRVVAFSSFCERSSGAGFYVPWGTQQEATVGSLDEECLLFPPFASCRITTVQVMFESAGGATDVGVRDDAEADEQVQNAGTIGAGDLVSVTLNWDWTDGEPKCIYINPTTDPDSVRVQVYVEEVA